MNRSLRVFGTLAITGLCVAYLLWKIDLSRTWDILVHARTGWFLLSVGIMTATVLPMAWRWQRLLDARGIHEGLPWLVRAYFTSYTAGQVLPTAVGGDAMRIYETGRRHPGNTAPITGIVLLERALGGAATVTLAAVGFLLAIGKFNVGAYLWIEAAFFVAHDRPRRGVVFAPRAPAARMVRAVGPQASRRKTCARGVRGRARVSRPPRIVDRPVRADTCVAGRARARDLGGR